MFITELFENQTKHAAFCFGRMNPPTQGHQQLINTVAQQGRGGDFFIFTSQSQDPKKNPLDYQTKVRFLRALYPGIASHVVYEPGLKTIMQVASWLYSKGYRSVTFVAGSDRLVEFRELLEKYNGKEMANGYYQFNSINFVSSGDRDPDAEGVTGVSASAARAAAAAGDYEAFSQAVGAGKLTQQLYDAVRQGMNLNEDIKLDPKVDAVYKKAKMSFPYAKDETEALALYVLDKEQHDVRDLEQVNDREDAMIDKLLDLEQKLKSEIEELKQKIASIKQVSEDAAGVGVVATNKRMAKDPRYSMSITKDVQPSTPRKMAKAFRLV